jgi:quercetin dioxygenase-like cupin family protein
MNAIEPSGFSVGEVEAYRGRGTRGWHVEVDEQAREFVVIEAGAPFGGEWPEAQVWHVIDGQGRLSCEATRPSVHVGAGDGYRFAPGERRLIVAETTMRILITPSISRQESP